MKAIGKGVVASGFFKQSSPGAPIPTALIPRAVYSSALDLSLTPLMKMCKLRPECTAGLSSYLDRKANLSDYFDSSPSLEYFCGAPGGFRENVKVVMMGAGFVAYLKFFLSSAIYL